MQSGLIWTATNLICPRMEGNSWVRQKQICSRLKRGNNAIMYRKVLGKTHSKASSLKTSSVARIKRGDFTAIVWAPLFTQIAQKNSGEVPKHSKRMRLSGIFERVLSKPSLWWGFTLGCHQKGLWLCSWQALWALICKMLWIWPRDPEIRVSGPETLPSNSDCIL